jgi:shikimate 5-dehydrogenase
MSDLMGKQKKTKDPRHMKPVIRDPGTRKHVRTVPKLHQNLDTFPELVLKHRLSGLNVTKPYKESVISFLNELDVTAKEIGAVNCIKISWENDTPYLKGYNTDYYGFAQSIKINCSIIG